MIERAGILAEKTDEIVQIESRDAGTPIRLATEFDVPGTIDKASFFGAIARNGRQGECRVLGRSHFHNSPEPVGVVGSVAPWYDPLQMGAWKILPAVAAGNTIVLKPSELTPLTSLIFAETATEAGIPAGVINIVTGTGPVAEAALISHPDVAMVSFTGSTAVGKQIGATAAGLVKRVVLELGGKAPFVVFDDADIEAAARGAVAGVLINAGQDCTAVARAYIQRSRFDEFVERTAELMRGVKIGPVADPATDLGPVITQRHRERISGMVERALAAGAKAVCGGSVPVGTPDGGAYFEPTLIVAAAQDSEIVQDEVFGPVLVALPFDTDDEAIELANDTRYGLAASVWTTNVYRAGRATREIQAGCVWVNDHIPIWSEMPHGGYKASGFGKDMSTYAVDEYTNVKHIASDITGRAHKGWHDTIFRSAD